MGITLFCVASSSLGNILARGNLGMYSLVSLENEARMGIAVVIGNGTRRLFESNPNVI